MKPKKLVKTFTFSVEENSRMKEAMLKAKTFKEAEFIRRAIAELVDRLLGKRK